VVVACPNRLAEKLAQMNAVATAAERESAARLQGDARALSMWVPVPDSALRLVDAAGEGRARTVAFGPGDSGRRDDIALATFLARRDTLARWKAAVDAVASQLPAGALSAEDLFGATDPSVVFRDNCHLTEEGTRRAAQAIAARIEEAIRR
jgi:hypothetical protein